MLFEVLMFLGVFYLLFLLWKIVDGAGGQGRHAQIFWLLATWLREMGAVIPLGTPGLEAGVLQ